MLRRLTPPFALGLLAAALLAGCDRAAPPAAGTPSAAPAPTEDAYALAATGHGFATGPVTSARPVYVFFDPTCPHCAQLWRNAQSLQQKLKIVWLPIGWLRPQSLPQAVTILSAPDPAAAMAQNEASVLNHGGGITAMGSPDEAVVAQVKANTELFHRLQADSVPLIVYRNARTGEVGQHAGVVDAAQLQAFAGL
jgi:thiol:disulfide interchange protein DsbG